MESERLRNSLLSALSHDLRTPLAVLTGLVDTLFASTPALVPAQMRLVDALREESLRMHHMVANLLDMARIQSGEIRLRLEWQSLEELVGTAIRAVRPVLADRLVRVAISPDVPLLSCDAVLVERVFVNLLENVAKYTPAGTPASVEARTRDDRIEVTVADTGPGVPRGMEEAIFEKFTRGRNESATPGVGLGLAICRAIVEAHRGEIRYRANTPHGACFIVVLPRGAPPELPQEESP